MVRRPPRSTRTDTRFPYTTLFRSPCGQSCVKTKHGIGNDPRTSANASEWILRKFAPAVSKTRSEEHTSELQSLMRISYAVFCLKKKSKRDNNMSVQIQDIEHLDVKHSRLYNSETCEENTPPP